jgi:hypothetical protein|tara:strand:+ start:281 stop:703 length:423 start_codon:yes stop_codon:yes gene_type:complete
MAFTGNYLCTSFKSELLQAVHNFSSHTFKLALFTNSATLDASTTAYSTSNEVSGTGYSAGGATVSSITINTSGTTVFIDFADITFSNSTITARGALLYNSSASDKAVAVFDFGADQASSSSTFTINVPTADASSAIVRIA